MGKQKHSNAMGVLYILCEANIHTISKTWKKWILIIREKYGENNFPKLRNINTFPKIWDDWILMLRENYEKRQTFQSYRFLA